MKKAIAIALGVCASLGLTAFAADDDLEVVKRATQAAPQVEATPAAKATPAANPANATRGEKPTWFKVEVFDKASGKRRVSVNLPLAVVEIFGDEVPVHWSCGDKAAKEPHCGLKLKEVLAQLQKGQPLVEVEKDTERIRVWVE